MILDGRVRPFWINTLWDSALGITRYSFTRDGFEVINGEERVQVIVHFMS